MERRVFLAPTEKLGLSRPEAAAYIGVTHSAFDALVAAGEMPRPRRVGKFERWDRRQIEVAFSVLPQDETLKTPCPYANVGRVRGV